MKLTVTKALVSLNLLALLTCLQHSRNVFIVFLVSGVVAIFSLINLIFLVKNKKFGYKIVVAVLLILYPIVTFFFVASALH